MNMNRKRLAEKVLRELQDIAFDPMDCGSPVKVHHKLTAIRMLVRIFKLDKIEIEELEKLEDNHESVPVDVMLQNYNPNHNVNASLKQKAPDSSEAAAAVAIMEEILTPMNREQRRAAAKAAKKEKHLQSHHK